MEITLSKEAKERVVAVLVKQGKPLYDTREGEYYTDGNSIWWRSNTGEEYQAGDAVAKADAGPISAFVPGDVELSWPNEAVANAAQQTALLRAELYDELG